MNKYLTIAIVLFVFVMLFGSYIITAGADTYLHQESNYIEQIKASNVGERYEVMRIDCETNEGFKDDRCTRGYVTDAFSKALHGLYYLDEDSKEHILQLFADTYLMEYFDTRVELRYNTQLEVRDLTEDEVDQMVQDRIMELLNN